MSQTAVFVRVNGNLHEEVYPSIPDHDEAIQICKDFGYESSDAWSNGNLGSVCLDYEWCEIWRKGTQGGESGSDNFLSDGELCYLYDCADYEKAFALAGYKIESIQTDSDSVEFEELEE